MLLNQTFHPDVASTAQHLTDLASGLIERGHQVTVLTGSRAYDDPKKIFARSEIWRGIRIIRIGSTGFGKESKWRRAADFTSFLLRCSIGLVFLPRHDAVVALTSPPLISFLGAWTAGLRRSRFFYWVMDFNPDEAIVAGWLKPGSLAARILDSMSRFSLRRSTRIIALDHFMRDRIIAKGIPATKITVLPPWSHDTEVHFDPEGRDRFRKTHGLDDKFVVMYSGNHSPCHPLDTLIAAARRLSANSRIAFCFIGGGSEWRRIKAYIGEKYSNMKCLPYQPLNQLSCSLSAADLHVVVMGTPFVGLVHPSKIYNALRTGRPVLYIGPHPSPLSEILDSLKGQYCIATSRHGEVDQVVQHIRFASQQPDSRERRIPEYVMSNFSKESVLPKLIAEMENG